MNSNRPIHCLQTMLQRISQYNGSCSMPIPDGIYGPKTESAVSQFQQTHDLPVTGITNQKTWEAIVREHEQATIALSKPQPLEIIWEADTEFCKDTQHPHLCLVQSMLKCIGESFHQTCIPDLTGILDDSTEQSIRVFQHFCGLPQSGVLNKETWKHLTLQYPIAVLHQKMNNL